MTATGHTTRKLDDYVHWGRYVIFVCILAELTILSQVSSMFYMMYGGAAPRIVSCGSVQFDPQLEDKEVCEQYFQIANNCTPELKYQFRSANVEFGYLCGAGKTVKSTIAIQMLGVLVGCIVFGQLSDTFGRKVSMALAQTGMLAAWLMVSQSRDLVQFTATRTIVGFFTGGGISVLNVFILENVPKHLRMWINMAITWSPNIPPMALIAWMFPTWNGFAYANAFISVPPLIFLFLYIHESPRWLVAKGRVDEARSVIEHQLKTSEQLHLMDEQFEEVLMNEYNFVMTTNAKQRQYSYYHLYTKSFKLAMYATILAFSFCSTSIINYGIIFNMEKVSGSIYLNAVYTGLMRYSCNLIFGYLDLKFKFVGRKFIHTSGLVIVLASLVLVVVAYYFDLTVTLSSEIRIAILLASSMTSQVYIANGITGSELFPTPIRNIGYSYMHMWNRAGVVVSPFIFYLQDLWIGAPYLLMIILAVIDTLAFECCLPETKGKPLREHMPGNKSMKRLDVEEKLIDHSKLDAPSDPIHK